MGGEPVTLREVDLKIDAIKTMLQGLEKAIDDQNIRIDGMYKVANTNAKLIATIDSRCVERWAGEEKALKVRANTLSTAQFVLRLIIAVLSVSGVAGLVAGLAKWVISK